MDKFTQHAGIAAPILRNNIDTDTIIPSREMKTVSKTGLADGLFAPWRYVDANARTPDPTFILNQAGFENASIILAGDNFGCGSSREHAVWALKEYGFKCIIAEGFGSIFFRNCVRNGILPMVLEKQNIAELAEFAEAEPQKNIIEIDLEQQLVGAGNIRVRFKSDESDREMLLNGLDPIDVTLKLSEDIAAFQQRDQMHRPWLY